MTVKIANRRRSKRHAVVPGAARIDFVDPADPRGSQPRSLSLLDLSPSGLSFRLPAEMTRPAVGASLGPSSIRIGKTVTIRGELVVMHVSLRGDGGLICGALFYPETDDDLVKLRSVVAGIEAAGAG